MKKVLLALLVAVATLVPAQAASAQSGCTSNTYLHVECATHAAFGWVEYDCCRVINRERYDRINANRVDIRVRAYRNGQNMCRWVIVRGHDFSKYAVYHPNYNWTTNLC